MSEIVVLGLKLAFLAALWLAILFVAAAIRTDVFGRKISTAELQIADGQPTRKQLKAAQKLPKKLKITHGPQAGTTLPLGEPIIIGRADDCQLVLNDDYVSTHHARISRGGGYDIIEDLGSTNGTFVNNQRITVPTQIGTGDSVRIGQSTMLLER
ncbi:MAG: FHA domain-containing protein [Propionibacteriaceae bacterium]|jgi:pSer/pThr/pTyr-binding forkhead associated (FHA) protein|nr:FHA domain-containing protein [Propionibacteriaceae bacterium]